MKVRKRDAKSVCKMLFPGKLQTEGKVIHWNRKKTQHGDQDRDITGALLEEEGRDLDEDHWDFMIFLIFWGMGSQSQSIPCVPHAIMEGLKGIEQ